LNREIWKPIPGFENLYHASNLGRIKTLKTGLIRTGHKQYKGYLKVGLYSNYVKNNYFVYRLVMASFKGPSQLEVNHLDGNKENNSLSNLEYATALENSRHARAKNLLRKS